MSALWDVEEGGRRVQITRSAAGRAAVAGERFMLGLPVASLGLFVFFMFDILGPKEFDVERTLSYAAAAVGLAVVVALAWAIAGAMRHEAWEIDFATSTIRYETRLSMGSPQGVEVDTSNLTGVRVVRAGLLRESRIELVFEESVETAVRTRLGAGFIDDAANALKNLAESESLTFEAE